MLWHIDTQAGTHWEAAARPPRLQGCQEAQERFGGAGARPPGAGGPTAPSPPDSDLGHGGSLLSLSLALLDY